MARIEIDPNYTAPTFSRATAPTDIFKKEDIQNVAAALSTHVHDGTGKGLPVVLAAGSISGSALVNGSVTSAQIADGTITTADLAANAVTQSARATATAPQSTTSTSYIDMNEMSLSLTTTGGPVLVWLVADVYNSAAANNIQIALNLDGGVEVAPMTFTPTAPTSAGVMTTFYLFSGLAAGAHTFTGRWLTTAGTATLNGTQRFMMAMELKR